MKKSLLPSTILICLAMTTLCSCKTVEPTAEAQEDKSSFESAQSENVKSSDNQVLLSSEINQSSQDQVQTSSQAKSSSSGLINLSSANQNSSEAEASSASNSDFTSVTASFNQTDVTVNGTYTIEKIDGKFRLKLSDNFSSSSGPDLHIVLTKRLESKVTTYNYKDFKNIPGEVVVLGGRETVFKGAVRDIDLTEAQLKEYNTVIIQCIQYSHTYATASINW
jgi:hypothetical protein